MREFKLKTEAGQKVYEIQLNLRSDESKNLSTTYHKEGTIIEELKIVYQTDSKIALSDEYITLLYRAEKGKKEEDYNLYLEKTYIRILTKETYFPNGIFAKCYSTKNPKVIIPKMKKVMLEKIDKEYGFLMSNDIKNKIESL